MTQSNTAEIHQAIEAASATRIKPFRVYERPWIVSQRPHCSEVLLFDLKRKKKVVEEEDRLPAILTEAQVYLFISYLFIYCLFIYLLFIYLFIVYLFI